MNVYAKIGELGMVRSIVVAGKIETRGLILEGLRKEAGERWWRHGIQIARCKVAPDVFPDGNSHCLWHCSHFFRDLQLSLWPVFWKVSSPGECKYPRSILSDPKPWPPAGAEQHNAHRSQQSILEKDPEMALSQQSIFTLLKVLD